MACRSETGKSRCGAGRRLNLNSGGQEYEEFVANDLEDAGREQFFRHYGKSKRPIRDVRKKPEPHIEHAIGAENYLRRCYQDSIAAFCRSSERYLFLCTTCENREVENGEFFGKRFVVGYLTKKARMRMATEFIQIMLI